MKKRFIIVFICVSLIFVSIIVSFADGGGNMDGSGGGGTGGGGTSQNKWSSGDEGVRVTIVDVKNQKRVGKTVDLTNRTPKVKFHFGKNSKIEYRNGKQLTLSSAKYEYTNPNQKLPVIISSNKYGKSDINKIKKYFCNSGVQKIIAEKADIDFEDMTSGEYKLLLEPIAYFTFGGNKMAMTATETALYNKKLGGNKLRNKLASISHKNLPLSMFLEKDDLGFKAWKGISDTDRAKAKDDDTIIKMLGLGIVYFNNEPKEDDEVVIPPVKPPNPEEPSKPDEGGQSDYEYRTDTDVITSIKIKGSNRTPKNPVKVIFNIKGKDYSMNNIYLPKGGGEQYAWVKWHTPKTPEKITIKVSSNATTDKATIIANVVDLKEKVPPDPKAKDRNDNFKTPNLPNPYVKTNATYGEWDCYWVPHWVYYSDGDGGGEWVDEGWYEWKWLSYNVSLTANMQVKADSKVPTSKSDRKEMKSGYGFNVNVDSKMNYDAPETSFTGAQNVNTLYPEFKYETYNRVLQRIQNGLSSKFELKNNKYSTYNQKAHFTPIWYKDGAYDVYGQVMDVWTPVGELRTNVNNAMTIKGNLFQDWHIGPLKD